MANLKLRGYEYRGFRLGDIIKHRGNEHEIIGFSEVKGENFIAIDCNYKNKYSEYNIKRSCFVTSYCETDKNYFLWIKPDEIEVVKKYINESVLELDYQQIFDQIGIRISYQNFEIIPRGKFTDDDLGIYSILSPSYNPPRKELYVLGDFSMYDNKIIIVSKEDAEIIKNKVELLNKKYKKIINKKSTVESKRKDFIDSLTEEEAKEILHKIIEILSKVSEEE